MQLISPGLLLAAMSAKPLHPRFSEFLQREDVRHLVTFALFVLVGSQLGDIVAVWIASKVMAEEGNSTLGNSVKVWLFRLLVAVGVVAAMVITEVFTVWAGHANEPPWRLFLVLVGASLLASILGFLIPMRIYDISFWRAFVLLFIAGLINGGVTTVFNTILIPALHLDRDIAKLEEGVGKTKEEKVRFIVRLIGQESPDEIDRLLDDALQPIGPRPSLADQEAMVRTLQQKLTARQRNLNGNDSHALDVYQAQVTRYLQFRNQVLANRTKA